MMKVSELRTLLSNYHDDMIILVTTAQGEFNDVLGVHAETAQGMVNDKGESFPYGDFLTIDHG